MRRSPYDAERTSELGVAEAEGDKLSSKGAGSKQVGRSTRNGRDVRTPAAGMS